MVFKVAECIGAASKTRSASISLINLCVSGVEVGQDQEFAVGTKGAGGQGKLEARITSPSGKSVPCVVELWPGKEASLVKYIPKEEGAYSVDVLYDGNPVPGSPFPVEAMLPPDPSKVRMLWFCFYFLNAHFLYIVCIVLLS